MTISELIRQLKIWEKKFGDIKIEAVHSGFYGHHEIMEVTMPDNRRVVIIVTMPAEWLEKEIEMAREKEGETP